MFAVEPEDIELAYRKLPDDLILDHILCVKQTRTIDNGSVFSIHNRHFQILKKTLDCLKSPPRNQRSLS